MPYKHIIFQNSLEYRSRKVKIFSIFHNYLEKMNNCYSTIAPVCGTTTILFTDFFAYNAEYKASILLSIPLSPILIIIDPAMHAPKKITCQVFKKIISPII
jgi:hypothetical protein